MKQRQKVIVGVSGGVDSSIALHLLKKQGYEVHGLFMKNWEEDDNAGHCQASLDLNDAKVVCEKLNVPLHTVNFSTEYWEGVFENFLKEFEAGRTPNPDILCNKEIKFKVFLKYAESLGADFIATGHYVRKSHDSNPKLLKGLDSNKDQSYFLYAIDSKAIAKSLFPVGELNKTKVRALAKELGLINHAKKDSTGICFIGEKRFNAFLGQYLQGKPGPMLDENGQIIGEHQGLIYYTLGQRKGIGLGGLPKKHNLPWFVAEKNLRTNSLVLVQGARHPKLLQNQVIINQVHWIQGELPCTSNLKAKTRYRQAESSCQIIALSDRKIQVNFLLPQRSVTPGQSLVFYHDEICLGGGIIESSCLNLSHS